MKKIVLSLCLIAGLNCFGQDVTEELHEIIRVNVISPGIELEMPINNASSLALNAGVGVSGSYKNLSYTNSGFTYFISPFMDLSYKNFYSLDKRIAKGKSISGNSGNYWGLRLLSNFKEFESENIIRKDNIDFAFGPTWGIQRAYGNFHFLFDIGSVYYFDTKGNNGFFPLMLQLNIGYNLKEW